MENPFNKYNDFFTSEEYKNMDKKKRFIKLSLLAPNNKEIEEWEKASMEKYGVVYYTRSL